MQNSVIDLEEGISLLPIGNTDFSQLRRDNKIYHTHYLKLSVAQN